MTATKLLLETLRMADGGSVICEVQAPNGERLQSVIEQSFFEEFSIGGAATNPTNPRRQLQIITDNAGYLEAEAERLWQQGQRALVIR